MCRCGVYKNNPRQFFYVVYLPNLGDLVNIMCRCGVYKNNPRQFFYVVYSPNLGDLVNIRYDTTFI